MYRISPGLALVQTLDFFPPLIDDAFQYGQVAAANSLSDIYAMNARPLTALNIVGFPDDELPLELLGEILRGAAERVAAAGAVTLGGHSVRDKEVKFGLSVTGIIDPNDLVTNASSVAGDELVLTKPLGTGFVTTANKKGECPADVLSATVASMIQLNEVGRDAFRAAGGTHSVTDVTGFGLIGHAAEMADGAGVTIVLDSRRLPRIAGSERLATKLNYSRASKTNREAVAARSSIEQSADALGVEYAFDPQTSGGLLIAVHPANTAKLLEELRTRGAAGTIVGRVVPRRGGVAIVIE